MISWSFCFCLHYENIEREQKREFERQRNRERREDEGKALVFGSEMMAANVVNREGVWDLKLRSEKKHGGEEQS